MPVITFRHLDFSYESPYAEVFKDLDLLIDTGWRAGLIGRNGQGKSTLLQLIAGRLIPQGGELEVPTATRCFPVSVDPNLSTRDAIKDAIGPFRIWEKRMQALLEVGDDRSLADFDEIHERYLATGGYQLDAHIERELTAIDLPIETLSRPFSTLSGGEQTRTLITGLFAGDGAYPLIDEPTNHLDMAGRRLLMDYLATKSGFLLVSHDRHFIDGAVDHIISINKHDIRVNNGNYTSWRKHMDDELRSEARTRVHIEREIAQLSRAAQARRRGAESREKDKHRHPGADTGFIGHRAAKQMKRAMNFERRIETDLARKHELLRNQEKERSVKIPTGRPSAQRLLTLQNVTLGYANNTLFREFSLTISPQDRVAFVGRNGCGKTSLFDAISGDLACRGGIIHKPGHVSMSRAYQQPLWNSGSLRDTLAAANIDETEFRQYMGVLGLDGDIFERDLATFSQGQLKKVDLIRSMLEDADLLLWDEPLNYVDLYSREQLERAIVKDAPTLLFIEHDRSFVSKVATRVIDLDDFSPGAG